MSPTDEDALGLASLNDGKNCMTCKIEMCGFSKEPCRSCIAKASTTGKKFPNWEPKSED